LKKSDYIFDVYLSALEEYLAPIEHRLLNGVTNYEDYRYNLGRRESLVYALETIKELIKGN